MDDIAKGICAQGIVHESPASGLHPIVSLIKDRHNTST